MKETHVDLPRSLPPITRLSGPTGTRRSIVAVTDKNPYSQKSNKGPELDKRGVSMNNENLDPSIDIHPDRLNKIE